MKRAFLQTAAEGRGVSRQTPSPLRLPSPHRPDASGWQAPGQEPDQGVNEAFACAVTAAKFPFQGVSEAFPAHSESH